MTLKKLDLKFSAGNPMLQFTQKNSDITTHLLAKTSFIVLPCVSQSL